MNQVLARKWRPKSFSEVVGQEHVVRALTNALSSQRLHHAYLFTGTRGVGKTTIARIFAKCLNCDTGITAVPCGMCDSCQEIDSGRFIDLLEVDAASRTKVEDTRDLLENVQYLPVNGRVKVYLIDEVHMLSGHSFNALLKTLEEPPSHVKFLLATTDPQKLPITVLSRCLQFNLKILPPELIAKQLNAILDKEQIPHEQEATDAIAVAASGSVRDSLSLLDQAIAYGNGSVKAIDVYAMLGTIDAANIFNLLDALANTDVEKTLSIISELSALAVDFRSVLDELLNVLHQISIAQFLPNNNNLKINAFKEKFSREDLQLYYQIALIGKRDLVLAPNFKIGFEMIMLRMLAFTPSSSFCSDPHKAVNTTINNPALSAKEIAPEKNSANIMAPNTVMSPAKPKAPALDEDPEKSLQVLSKLSVTGTTLALIRCCTIARFTNNIVELLLDPNQAPLLNKKHEERLSKAFSDLYERPIHVKINIGTKDMDTLANVERRGKEQKKEKAVESLQQDPRFQKIIKTFNASLLPASFEITGE